MPQRTYGQYCGVAKALDVLGERWTLLVIRDLLPGPRRYKELASQLPALGTDMLTARLRSLEDHGLLVRQEVGGQGGGVLYGLTEQGHALRPLVEELARIGIGWLTTPGDTTDQLDIHWAVSTARMFIDPATTPTGSCHFTVDGEDIWLTNDSTNIDYSYQAPRSNGPSVHIDGTNATLLATVTGHNPQLVNLDIDGDTSVAQAWIASITGALPAPIVPHDDHR
jgi:DNA-binding HxlR family transcriptional regulator